MKRSSPSRVDINLIQANYPIIVRKLETLKTKCNKFFARIHHLRANLGWHYEVTTDILWEVTDPVLEDRN